MKIKDKLIHERLGLEGRGRRNRRGGMLLIVLIILAVTVILLSSALMVTTSARKRYYVTAEQDQAGLTAMSAAKLLERAIFDQDITDAQIDNMIVQNYEATMDGISVPGMAGNASDSITTVKFSYIPFGADPKFYIAADVSTKIDAGVDADGSTEQIRLVLRKKPEPPEGFDSLLNITSSGNQDVGNAYYGDNAPLDATNLIVINAKALVGSSAKVFCSDVIFTQANTGAGGGHFEGDVVFFDQGSYNINAPSGDAIRADGYIMKIGIPDPSNPTKVSTLFTNGSGSPAAIVNGFQGSFLGKGLYVQNAIANVGKAGDGFNASVLNFANGVYAATGSNVAYYDKKDITRYIAGGVTATFNAQGSAVKDMTAATRTDMETRAAGYLAKKGIIQRSIATSIQNAIDNLTEAGCLIDKASVDALVANDVTKALQLKSDQVLKNGGTVSLSACYIDVSTNPVVKGHVVFPLSTDQTIYLVGNGTLHFAPGGSFDFRGGGGGKFGRIVSFDNSSIIIDDDWDLGNSGGNVNVILGTTPTGIISADGNLSKITKTIHMSSANTYVPQYGGQNVTVNSPLYTYTSAVLNGAGAVIEPVTKVPQPVPHLICFMFGSSSTVAVGSGANLQGYYGVYGGSSKFCLFGTPVVYARLEVANFYTDPSKAGGVKKSDGGGFSGGQPHIPYCPPPNQDDDPGNKSKSAYIVYGYQKI